MIYQTSKQLTKFGLSGLTAATIDFLIYYACSSFLPTPLAKGIGFCVGTYVTYNLNKYWTWRKNDKSKLRLAKFISLYGISMIINIAVNQYGLHIIPENEFLLSIRPEEGFPKELFAFKLHKIFAFALATAVSSVVNFLGQKLWVFREAKG
jgi:putative flippase GtrA